MTVEIVPSVLANQAAIFRRRLRLAERIGRIAHIDLMDGHFVPGRSLTLRAAQQIRPSIRTDVHLMVGQPEDWLPLLIQWPTRRLVVHAELGGRLRFILAAARANRWFIDLAVNPRTPLSSIYRWARYVHGFQVMTVRPGRYGAPYIPAMEKRIQRLSQHFPRRSITADGGVTPATAPRLVAAGARRLVVGSYLQRASDPQQAMQTLRRSLRP